MYPLRKDRFPTGIADFLTHDQVYHAKTLKYPWPEDESVFHGGLSPHFRPENQMQFKLGYYLIPSECAVYLRTCSLDPRVESQIIETRSGNVFYKLFVHPDAKEYYNFLAQNDFEYVSEEKSEFWTTPLSSFRSLLVWKESESTEIQGAFIVKLSLDRQVFGYHRLIEEPYILKSHSIQKMFESYGEDQIEPHGLTFFSEVCGLYPSKEMLRFQPEKIGGQIIRQLPSEVMSGRKRWIPFFALISPERKEGLLIQKIIARTGLPTYNFIKEYLIKRFITVIEEINFKRGLVMEPHLQDLMLETDETYLPTGRFVIRDLGDFAVDIFAHLVSEIPSSTWICEKPEVIQLKNRAGRTFECFAYAYKNLNFDVIMAQLAQFDDTVSEREVRSLSGELIQSFLELVQKYYKVQMNENKLQTVEKFPAIRKHLRDLGNEIVANAAQRLDPFGKSVSHSEVFEMGFGSIVRKGLWHELSNTVLPPNSHDEILISFVKNHQFFLHKNILIARDSSNLFQGVAFVNR